MCDEFAVDLFAELEQLAVVDVVAVAVGVVDDVVAVVVQLVVVVVEQEVVVVLVVVLVTIVGPGVGEISLCG